MNGAPSSAGRRGRLLVGATAVVAAVVVVVLVGIDMTGSDPSTGRAGQPTDVRRGEAMQVAEALRALPDDPERFVAQAARNDIAGRFEQAIPPDTTLTADPRTWHPDGLGGGVISVRATPPGGAATDYLAIMVREDESWKVLATLPATAQSLPLPTASKQAP